MDYFLTTWKSITEFATYVELILKLAWKIHLFEIELCIFRFSRKVGGLLSRCFSEEGVLVGCSWYILFRFFSDVAWSWMIRTTIREIHRIAGSIRGRGEEGIHLQWKFLHFPAWHFACAARGKLAIPRYWQLSSGKHAATLSLFLPLAYKYLLARQYSDSISGVILS